MTTPPEELLGPALDAATGRASRDSVAASWLAYAHSIVTERRAVLDAPTCPAAVLGRVQALFAKRPKPWLHRVLELVFDSQAELAPALRGAATEHALRYESGELAVDVEVSRSSQGRRLLLLAVTADVADLQTTVDVVGGETRTVHLDASGAARVELGMRGTSAVIVLSSGDEEMARTPAIPLE